MATMGLSRDIQQSIYSLLAGILHLGNVQFGDKNNYATVLSERGETEGEVFFSRWSTSSLSDLHAPCLYFGIQSEHLKTKLISKRLDIKEHSGTTQVDQTFTVDKAIFTRDALAKSVYSRIFDYLIQVTHCSIERSLTLSLLRRSMRRFKRPIAPICPSVFSIFTVLKSSNGTVLNNFASIMSMRNCNRFSSNWR